MSTDDAGGTGRKSDDNPSSDSHVVQAAGFYSRRRKEDISSLEAEWQRRRVQLEKYFK